MNSGESADTMTERFNNLQQQYSLLQRELDHVKMQLNQKMIGGGSNYDYENKYAKYKNKYINLKMK